MKTDRETTVNSGHRRSKLPHRFRETIHELLVQSHQEYARSDFLRRAVSLLLGFSACDATEIRIDEAGIGHRCRATRSRSGIVHFDCGSPSPEGERATVKSRSSVPEQILEAVLHRCFVAAAPFSTRARTFWMGDSAQPILVREPKDGISGSHTIVIGGQFQSLALIPFPVDDKTKGVLFLGGYRRDFFNGEDIQSLEAIAVTLGVALANQAAQWALRERVKELTCLYGIAKATQKPGRAVDDLLSDVVALLPPGWQYPEIARARIVLGGREYTSDGFQESSFKQIADIVVKGERIGVVEVFYAEERPELDEGPFLKEERNLINAIAETLGMAVSYQDTQAALRERVKELTCLHGIAELGQIPGISLEQLIEGITKFLPPGWQYPEITSSCIILDGRTFATKEYRPEGTSKQTATINVKGSKRGAVEVLYSRDDLPELDEGPFLKEERNLINEVARLVGLIVERREAEEEKVQLQDQLRHADRLATIGQLAAGAAHEINEPLGSVLGFAELAKNCPALPKQAEEDLEKIITAALLAREIIKNLMIFARQMPTRKTALNLNGVIAQGLSFLETRITNGGIELVWATQEDLPIIEADPAQIQQVLVNLAVNAIQAMPEGGTLTIETSARDEVVSLIVEDSGTGMNKEVLEQIFNPFFTTKGVAHGTGLGLSVVHGIVTSHGGKVLVESEPGKGSRFEVLLPTIK